MDKLLPKNLTDEQRMIWLDGYRRAKEIENEKLKEIHYVIHGRGDSVTKVLKCKDILARG